MIARTGSLGVTEDLWRLLHYACYVGKDAEGHGWTPPEEVRDVARWAEEAVETDWDRGEPGMVPFDPSCKACRRAARDCMRRRGVNDETIQRLFRRVGARWDWMTRAKQEAKEQRDTGKCVPDPENPGFTNESTIRARQRRRERAIWLEDRLAARA